MDKLYNKFFNKNTGQQFYTGTISTLNPLTIKFFDNDIDVPVVPTSNLFGANVGDKLIVSKIDNQFFSIGISDNDNLMKCSLFKTSTQSLSNITQTVITFSAGSIEYDPLGMFVDATDRIIIPKNGLYDITIGCGWEANLTGYRIIYITSNGSVKAAGRWPFDAQGYWRGSLTRKIYLAKDDYIEFRAYQSSGGNLNIGGADSEQCHFSVVKI